jgi:MFS family permease
MVALYAVWYNFREDAQDAEDDPGWRRRVGRVATPVTPASALGTPRAAGYGVIITTLGVAQIVAWGSSYYLPAVLAAPISDDTGWPLTWVVGGLSLGLLAAGLVSPWVGRAIERSGGRPVLAASSVLLALGLAVLAIAQSLAVYFAAWLILGIGMGAGLYDPAFATLGRLYGESARPAITTLTLFGGFASTVCWPLSAFLVTHLGWRGTCLAYAAFHLAVLLPLYLYALPREAERKAVPTVGAEAPETDVPASRIAPTRVLVGVLAIAITLSAMISTLLSVHLLTILQSRGIGLAAAVALGALVGPSQVGARTIEFFIARYHHPIWTKLVSTLLVAIGVASLWAALPILAVPLVLYGAGIGLESIARGTLPLVLFAGPRYAAVMGKLAMPSLIAQAAAPSIGAALLGAYGTDGTLATLTAAAAVNFILAIAMLVSLKRSGIFAQGSLVRP